MDPVSARAIQSLLSRIPQAGARPQAAAPQADFSSALQGALRSVSEKQMSADAMAEKFQLGDPSVGLEETMLAMQSASLSFQAVVQVRNKMVQAYQDIMNMQV